ncbi:MAG: metallophosphoesterase [Pirellulaceae bacterium]|nr:metallophosphoesterase [Pirellulaceae bacterium]
MPLVSRRKALQLLFCSSVALGCNVRASVPAAIDFPPEDTHLLAFGDFGSAGKPQQAVSDAMQKYVATHHLQTAGQLLLGDNFYSKMPGGVQAPRWQSGFEAMYPAAKFPGPCWAVLGNHDYHDNAGGEQVQLAYARETAGTRWTMPHKWYRVDLPQPNPHLTLLFLDSNLPAVSGTPSKTSGKKRASLTAAEARTQLEWLKTQLASPRGTFTMVVAHHPLYSNGSHGDSKALIAAWEPLLAQHGVHLYLAGHDHDLQHLEFAGRKTSFVVSGGGGARVRALKSTRKTAFGKDVYGFSHLQIGPQRLLLRHIDANGAQVHAFAKYPDGTVKIEA